MVTGMGSRREKRGKEGGKEGGKGGEMSWIFFVLGTKGHCVNEVNFHG